jgi:hypothetical protein
MKNLILTFVIIAIFLSIYFFFIKTHEKEMNRAEEMTGQETIFGTPDKPDAENAAATGGSAVAPSEVTPKDERNKKPEEAFSSSKAGQQIIKVLELIRYLDIPTSVNGKEAWKNVQSLRQSPLETFKEIKQGLPSLSPQYETKKQFLVQFASNLDVDKEEKLNFLAKELKDAVAYAGEASSSGSATANANVQVSLTPSIIFETYLRVSGSPEAAEKLLLEVLPDAPAEVQKTLLSAYNKVNPKRTDELIKQYGLQTY